MDDAELVRSLAERDALVVHLSHHSNMREGGEYPDDLIAAIANKDQWNLSCVVVWPGHGMDLPGSIGLILRPTAVTQVISACGDDAGASQQKDGSDLSGGLPLSQDTFEQTFEVRPGAYNEWRVRGADVGGIFVVSPNGLYGKRKQPLVVEGTSTVVGYDIWPAPVELEDVFKSFPSLDVYTMGPTGPVLLSRPPV